VPSLVEFGLVVLEKKILKYFLCIFTLLLLSPLTEERRPSFQQTWIPSPQGWFVPSLVEIGPVVLEKKIFKYFLCTFTLLLLSPLKKGYHPSFEQTWIPFPPRMICAKSGWNWPALVLEKKICYYLPLQKGAALHFNKLEFPPPKDDLCHVWLKLAQWFWRRRFLNINCVFLLFCYYLPLQNGAALQFFLFCYYLPLEKSGALYFNKLESPSPKDDLCHVWLKLAKWFWRRSRKCKSLTDRQTTDNRWSEKLTWAFSSGELTKGVSFNAPNMCSWRF
jgi:hypothetical protein